MLEEMQVIYTTFDWLVGGERRRGGVNLKGITAGELGKLDRTKSGRRE